MYDTTGGTSDSGAAFSDAPGIGVTSASAPTESNPNPTPDASATPDASVTSNASASSDASADTPSVPTSDAPDTELDSGSPALTGSAATDVPENPSAGAPQPQDAGTPPADSGDVSPVSDSEGALRVKLEDGREVPFVGGRKAPRHQVQRYDGISDSVSGQTTWDCGRCHLKFSVPGVEHRDVVGKVCEPFLDDNLNVPHQVDPSRGFLHASISGALPVGAAYLAPGTDTRTSAAGPTPQVAAAAAAVAAGGRVTGPTGQDIAQQAAFGTPPALSSAGAPAIPAGGPAVTFSATTAPQPGFVGGQTQTIGAGVPVGQGRGPSPAPLDTPPPIGREPVSAPENAAPDAGAAPGETQTNVAAQNVGVADGPLF